MLVIRPAFRAGFGERFRLRDSDIPLRNTVWLHGSSAGEINLLRPLVRKMEEESPDNGIVVSAFSISGYTFAKKAFPEHRVIYFPIDFSIVIRRFFRKLQPTLIVLVESEFWPNFFVSAARAAIPLCILNGKMSDRSFRNAKKTRLLPWALRKASLFAMQTEDNAERLRALGVSAMAIHVTGNMKYDLSDEADGGDIRRQLRRRYGISDDASVWIGGSVHSGEDEALAWAHSRLVSEDYRLQLIIVPRFPAEAPAVADVLERYGLAAIRMTELSDEDGLELSDPRSVLIVDTIGELKRYYAMSDIAYVGGSLHSRGSNKGGHNLMEPAILGVAPMFGPYTFSFKETVTDLLREKAGLLVHDKEEICMCLRNFLVHPGSAVEMGARARQVIIDNRGATALNFGLIKQYLATS